MAASSRSATAPAVAGAAIEVPHITLSPEAAPGAALSWIALSHVPGALMSGFIPPADVGPRELK